MKLLWDIASSEQIHCLNGYTQMVWSVAFLHLGMLVPEPFLITSRLATTIWHMRSK